MRVFQRGHGGDGCDLVSTLCKYDLRTGDLFVLNWARVRRVMQGSISSELLMSGGEVRRILLLPLVTRYLQTIQCRYMYIAHVCFYVCCSDWIWMFHWILLCIFNNLFTKLSITQQITE